MTSIQQALRLQMAALLALWAGLFSISQAQPLVLTALPCLVIVRQWPPGPLRRQRRLWSHLVGLPVIGLCLALTPLGDRSTWLAGLSNLLWLLCGLKLLELEAAGAIRRNGLLLLIAIGTAGTLAQNLGASLLQGIAALLAVGSLLALEVGAAKSGQFVRSAVLLVAVSLPLVAALFVFTPRLGPLWLVQGGGARSGLSDQLDPGAIASLAKSDAAAMKLQFLGSTPPPPAERYWRVLTLSAFDGRRWTASRGEPALAQPTPATANALQPALIVLLEPTNLRWLPWQGKGLPLPPSIRRSSDGGLWQKQVVRSRALYRLAGTANTAPEPWRQVEPTAIDLKAPAGLNPRLEQLGQSWRGLPSNGDKVLAARRWFLEQGFRYTLEPGVLPKKAGLDHFLFEQQEGFCEHFASAFTALMREAGVPARLVVGYQGGEWVLPVGGGDGHLQVRQSDAHAWSEVWLPTEGWTRVDPTAWVVPSRVEQNLYDSLGAAGSADDQRRLGRAPDWMNWLQGQWQVMDLNWSLWVMQFDQARQEELLRRLFGAQPERLQGAVLMGSLAVLLTAALLMLRWLQPPDQDRCRRQLNRCLRRLGVEPRAGESLEASLTRACERQPDLSEECTALAAAYNQLRFGKLPHREKSQLWRNCLQRLAKKRSRW